MRPNQNNKRMRGRNNNNNRKGPNPLSRSYESNGPDVKIRGTAHHIGEKYLQLARDAQSSGDPVMAESYLQHAEHYFRIIAAAQQAQQQAQFGTFNRPAGEAEAEDLEEDDDFNGLTDRFASPAERAPQPQPQPYVVSPQGQNGPPAYNGQPNYPERPQFEPRSDRGGRNFQDRQDRQDRPERQDRSERGGHERNAFGERGQQPHREPRQQRPPRPEGQRYDNAPRYERQDARPVSDEANGSALPAFITAPVPVRVQAEPELRNEEEAISTEVLARPEAEGETGFAVRPRRRRRKPDFGEAAANKAAFED
jgi:hypothetical protein